MKIQHYGLKFPFTAQKVDKNFLDLNDGALSYVESQITHLLFTVKGSKLRDPEFGCNLLSYIFEPDDDTAWDGVKTECKNAISKYVNGCSLNTMEIVETIEKLKEKYLKINFSVTVNGETSNQKLILKI